MAYWTMDTNRYGCDLKWTKIHLFPIVQQLSRYLRFFFFCFHSVCDGMLLLFAVDLSTPFEKWMNRLISVTLINTYLFISTCINSMRWNWGCDDGGGGADAFFLLFVFCVCIWFWHAFIWVAHQHILESEICGFCVMLDKNNNNTINEQTMENREIPSYLCETSMWLV